MKTLVLEIRDRMTFIPALAIEMRGDDNPSIRLLWRAGYHPNADACVLLVRATGGESAYDPYEWGDRTMRTAHDWISRHWADLKNGDVVDVEFILGETTERKQSEVQP